jgi:hypothetical protein
MIMLIVPSWTMFRQSCHPFVYSRCNLRALLTQPFYHYLLLCSVIHEIGFMQIPIRRVTHTVLHQLLYFTSVWVILLFRSSRDDDKFQHIFNFWVVKMLNYKKINTDFLFFYYYYYTIIQYTIFPWIF